LKTVTSHSHSHSHTHKHPVAKEANEALADKVALERLDSLIAFLNAHFQNIELLPPTADIKKEEADVDADPKDPSIPTSSAPTLKVELDGKVAYIPLDTLDVHCDSEPLKKRVESVVDLALEVSTPLSALLPVKSA
jgi:cleavage and polyadenylation specificity factor subunit 3